MLKYTFPQKLWRIEREMFQMGKRVLSLLMAMLMATAMMVSPVFAVSLVIDDEPLVLDVEPQIVDGRTLVPLRAIFEKLGATVVWDNDLQKATATKGTDVVEITLNNATAYHNGAAVTLDVPATIVDNRTLVPARFVAEALNATVTWDQEAQTVYIVTTLASQPNVTAPVTPASPAPVPSTPAPSTTVAPQETGHKIYVTKSGKRYHYDPNCNGGTYYESTLEEALARNLTPCNKCVNG